MNIKVSHVTISKWIKKFDKYFKSISYELTKGLYLGNSDEWHADETVVRIASKKHYLWIFIDSETRLIASWNLNQSRGSECAFSLFKKAKTLVSPKSIVTDGLPSYIEPIKNTFKNSTNIVVEDFDDDISNNLIESFNKTYIL
ncbi:IS6 family transposase ISCbo1 [Terrisporobacter vanillatitrophus]